MGSKLERVIALGSEISRLRAELQKRERELESLVPNGDPREVPLLTVSASTPPREPSLPRRVFDVFRTDAINPQSTESLSVKLGVENREHISSVLYRLRKAGQIISIGKGLNLLSDGHANRFEDIDWKKEVKSAKEDASV